MSGRFITLGDSVVWGHGLESQNKVDSLISFALGQQSLERYAHAGAIIGLGNTETPATIHPEIPSPYPTVFQQAELVDDPLSVDLVLVNGGLNDVDPKRIMNPLTRREDMEAVIRTYCGHDMRRLLEFVLQRFKNARVILLGYYPLLSRRSNPSEVPSMLSLHGLALPSYLYQDPVARNVVDNCTLFWRESNAAFMNACREINSDRLFFVESPLAEDNSAFAPNAMVFEFDAQFNPEDETLSERRVACSLYYSTPESYVDREFCYRSSAGYPNPVGAKLIAKSIIESIAGRLLAGRTMISAPGIST